MAKVNTNSKFYRQIYVIVPVFNCKKYLRQAVESVILQPYQAIKIVLVDDGSTDGSSALCDELANQDKRVTVLHQENGGVASARNAGLESVLSIRENGDNYITFLDADDAWKANWITVQIGKLLEQEFDLIGFQSCTCNHLLTRRSEATSMQEGEYKGGDASIWIHANQHMGAMLYRVNLIKRYGIRFYNIKASEDKIFSMQCLYLAEKIVLVNQLMYLYRQNAMSAIHTRDKGISYFVPIIDAYIKSDADMAQWKNDTRGELSEGNLLAKIYIMDMAEEEYEGRNGAKRIRELLVERPDYQEITGRTTGSVQVDERCLYMQTHEKELVIKNRVRGFVYGVTRKIYYLPFVKTYVDRKRFLIKM